MSKIVERIIEVIRMLQEQFGDTVTVDRCYNPVFYLQSLNRNTFPLVLVAYKGSVYTDSKLYPCTSQFEIYFIDIKKEADGLLDLMQAVHDFFKKNNVQTYHEGRLVTGQKMIYQDQSLNAESNEHVIYVQRYNLLIP